MHLRADQLHPYILKYIYISKVAVPHSILSIFNNYIYMYICTRIYLLYIYSQTTKPNFHTYCQILTLLFYFANFVHMTFKADYKGSICAESKGFSWNNIYFSLNESKHISRSKIDTIYIYTYILSTQ